MCCDQAERTRTLQDEQSLRDFADLFLLAGDHVTLGHAREMERRGLIDRLLELQQHSEQPEVDTLSLDGYQQIMEMSELSQIAHMGREGDLHGSLLAMDACLRVDIKAAIGHYEEDPRYFFPFAIALIQRIESTALGTERDKLVRLAEKAHATMSLCESYQYLDYPQEVNSINKTQYSLLLGNLSHICTTAYIIEILQGQGDFETHSDDHFNFAPFSLLLYRNIIYGSNGIIDDPTNESITEFFCRHSIPVPEGSIIEKAIKGLMSRVLDIDRLSGESYVEMLSRLYTSNPDAAWGEEVRPFLSQPDRIPSLRPDIIMRELAKYTLHEIFAEDAPKGRVASYVLGTSYNYQDLPTGPDGKRLPVDNELYKLMLGIEDKDYAAYLVALMKGEAGYNAGVTYFDGECSWDLSPDDWETVTQKRDVYQMVTDKINEGTFAGFFLNLPYELGNIHSNIVVPLEVMIVPQSLMNQVHAMRSAFKQDKMGIDYPTGQPRLNVLREEERLSFPAITI